MTGHNPVHGVFSIATTPFTDNGSLDEPSIDSLADFLIARGVHGLAILGVMGEAHKLTGAERGRVIERFIRRADGRVPVVVGTGHQGTDAAVQLSRQAEAAGAAAVLVTPPRLARPDPAAMRQYYRAVAQAITIPVVVQDYPPGSGVFLPASLLAELSRESPNIRCVKLEDAPTPQKLTEITALSEGGLSIFGGLGGVFFLEELGRGAVGTMTGFAFPEILVEIYDCFQRGDRDGAAQTFYRYLPIVRFEFQPEIGLGIRKEILRRRGAIASAFVRAPTQPLDGGTLQELTDLMSRLELA